MELRRGEYWRVINDATKLKGSEVKKLAGQVVQVLEDSVDTLGVVARPWQPELSAMPTAEDAAWNCLPYFYQREFAYQVVGWDPLPDMSSELTHIQRILAL